MKYWLPRNSTTAWRRDTMASGSTRSFEGSRPMERTERGNRISRREAEVGLTMSFAMAATGAYPARKVCLKPIFTLTLIPCLVAGVYLHFRMAASTASSMVFPADSVILAS
jgi:hypothetical protein